MSRKRASLRRSQLITTFGPGAMLDLPRVSVLVGGLEHWVGAESAPRVSEPRLAKKLAETLGVAEVELRSPPLPPEGFAPVAAGVKAFRFPEWFLTQDSFLGGEGARARRLLHRLGLDRGRYRDDDGRRHPVVPVRFVRACAAGHIEDLDWYDYVHGGGSAAGCRAGQMPLYFEEHGTSSHLSEEWVRCGCGQARKMLDASVVNEALGWCPGKRRWLGPASSEECGLPFRLLVRSASNAYFSLTQSVISLPDRGERIRAAVDAVWGILQAVKARETLQAFWSIPEVATALTGVSEEEAWEEIEARATGSSGGRAPIKVAELEVLTRVPESAGGGEEFETIFSARAVPRPEWDRPWMAPVERVVLVDRLREVVAQYGFTRFEAISPGVDGEVEDRHIRRAQLATECRWLPAVENRGEGIYLQLSAAAMAEWLARPAVSRRGVALMRGFQEWAREHAHAQRQFPGLPYLLLHSLSHLLITTLSLRCGYPSTALRERVYAHEGLGYGVLIYTGASDAEGTLGGLVEAGRDIAFLVQEALESGRLCSNDPVCAQHDPARSSAGRHLQGAACHGCLLLPETSCEMHNDFLDRALVVATLEGAGAEMFAAEDAGGAQG